MLKHVTYVISVVSLIATISVLLTFRKRLITDRTNIQLGLSTSMLCLYVTGLFEPLSIQHPTTCEVATVFTHFCVLSTGQWSVVSKQFVCCRALGF